MYINNGQGLKTFNQTLASNKSLLVNYTPSYGILTFYNSSVYAYSQNNENEETVDAFNYTINKSKKDTAISKEDYLAIIIIICCVIFMGYFIYSIVTCYLKKPKTDELIDGVDLPQIEKK